MAELNVNTVVEVDTGFGQARFWEQRPGDWYVLHVKPRQEKALLDQVATEGLSLYVPIWPQVRFYGKRKKKIELPLFPGYAFLKGDRQEVIQADRTRRVVGIIDVKDQDQLAWELAGVDQLLTAGQPFAEHAGIKIGQRVCVRSGPLKGVQGLVESLENGDRLLIQVQTLGRALSVEIDISLVDPIGDD